MDASNKTVTLTIISILTCISLVLGMIGIDAGLPSAEQTQIVVPDKNTLLKIVPVLKTSRDEVYTSYDKQNKPVIRKFYRSGPELAKFHAIRSALLQSRLPDEQIVVLGLSKIKPKQLQFNPHVFQYGGFYLYSMGLVLKISEISGLLKITSDIEHYLKNPSDTRKIYTIPKAIGALFGALSVPMIFLCAYKMFGFKPAFLSALFMAAVPCLPVEMHSLKPYAFFLPFMLCALYLSIRILSEGRKSLCFFSGIFAGLSAGALIISGIIIMAPLTAWFFYSRQNKHSRNSFFWTGLVTILVGFSLAFFATNPYYILAFSEMKNELMGGAATEFGITFARFFHHLFVEFRKDLGWPLHLAMIAGLVFSIIKSTKEDWLILSVFLPFYLFLVFFFWNTPHYDLPIVPMAIIMSARFLAYLAEKIKWKFLHWTLIAILFLITLGNALYYDLIFLKSKAHLNNAGIWINTNIPEGSKISTSRYPHFGYGGYPPFDLLKYKINESISPDYYLVVGDDDPFLRQPDLFKEYEVVREFKLKTFLDRFYNNHRIKYLDQKIYIYKKL